MPESDTKFAIAVRLAALAKRLEAGRRRVNAAPDGPATEESHPCWPMVLLPHKGPTA